MYKENLRCLRRDFPDTFRSLEMSSHVVEELETIVEETKIGIPTIKVVIPNHTIYIHSKYDPLKEAERIIQNYSDKIGKNTHVMFYGVGFGYQIEHFKKIFPKTTFSIYEPSITLFQKFLSTHSLLNLPLNNIENIYLETNSDALQNHLNYFASSIFGDVVLITLPSYENIFQEQYNVFIKKFRDVIEARVYTLGVDYHFAKRWTLNSLMNLPITLNTPNFIKEKKDYFQNKPAIIVSAGPSLQEEYSNLKLIKEQGLAYIFAVGSANKALLAKGILPDAVCTYDPQEHNFSVFKGFEEQGIKSVPMIYGTSVGYETIQRYPGPKLHFITTQDTVTSYYLDKIDQYHIVDDAFSIAIVTIELLAKLEVGLIVLVGQNLAFKDNLFYSEDIKRGKGQGAEVQNRDLVDLVEVVDVYGNKIRSNSSFNQMRFMMEQYIQKHKQMEFINTTKGGANINGAEFKKLEDVINDRLQEKVVEKDWLQSRTKKVNNSVGGKIDRMNDSMINFIKLTKDISLFLENFKELIIQKKIEKINSLFPKFDSVISNLLENDFYKVYVRPTTRIQFEILEKNIKTIKHEVDLLKKASQIIVNFGAYLEECKKIYNEMGPIVKTIHRSIKTTGYLTEWKRYECASGEFYYSKDWTKKDIKIEKKNLKDEIINRYTVATKKNSTVTFKFRSSTIRVIGGKHINNSSKIRIKIDGYSHTFSSKDILHDENTTINFDQVLFEKNGLSNEIHEVEITNLDSEYFVFQGIEIDSGGRLLHKDEVLNIENIKVGERIRVNLNTLNRGIATVSSIGAETDTLIPLGSQQILGDFYILKVWENVEGQSKYITENNLGITKVRYNKNNQANEFLVNLVPILEEDNSPRGKVTSSTCHINKSSNWYPHKAFNKMVTGVSNAWATSKGVTRGWIQYEFIKPVILNCYTLVSQDSGNTSYDTTKRMPMSWRFQGLDGDSWITLDERLEVTDWKEKEKKYFVFDNDHYYKSYRILTLVNNGDPEFVAIGEIEFV